MPGRRDTTLLLQFTTIFFGNHRRQKSTFGVSTFVCSHKTRTLETVAQAAITRTFSALEAVSEMVWPRRPFSQRLKPPNFRGLEIAALKRSTPAREKRAVWGPGAAPPKIGLQ